MRKRPIMVRKRSSLWTCDANANMIAAKLAPAKIAIGIAKYACGEFMAPNMYKIAAYTETPITVRTIAARNTPPAIVLPVCGVAFIPKKSFLHLNPSRVEKIVSSIALWMALLAKSAGAMKVRYETPSIPCGPMWAEIRVPMPIPNEMR